MAEPLLSHGIVGTYLPRRSSRFVLLLRQDSTEGTDGGDRLHRAFALYRFCCSSSDFLSRHSHSSPWSVDRSTSTQSPLSTRHGSSLTSSFRIPEFGIRILQTQVSIARIESFFHEEEVASHAQPSTRQRSTLNLAFHRASLAWHSSGPECRLALQDIDITFPRGLTLVSGPTGSGKTSRTFSSSPGRPATDISQFCSLSSASSRSSLAVSTIYRQQFLTQLNIHGSNLSRFVRTCESPVAA